MSYLETALIICPSSERGQGTGRRIAGLTVGERLLLALEAQGVKRVAFIGDGARPESSRVKLEIFEPLHAPPGDLGDSFLLLTADLVFDRAMLTEDGRPDPDLPIRRVHASAWKAAVLDPSGWLALLGFGRAGFRKRFAVRVTDDESARIATRSLLLSLRKDIDGFVSKHINRHISISITRLLVRTGVRPNAVTIFIMLIGIASGVTAALAEPWWMLVIAGALFQAQSVLDGCDGEIARLTYRFSRRGQWLDTLGDDLTNWLFTSGLAVGQARAMDIPLLYVAAGIVFLAQVWSAGIMYQRLIRMGTGDLLALPNLVTGPPPAGAWGKIVKIMHVMSKNDTFTLMTSIMTAAQVPLAAFGLIAFGSFGMAYGLTVNEVRIRRVERETGEIYEG